MSAPVVARRCWDQRSVNTTDRIPGAGTAWPLASKAHKEILKWQRLIVNLRIYGHVQVTYDPFSDISFDFKLKDVPGYEVPTELSHLSLPGLLAGIGIESDGSVGDASGFSLGIAIGLDIDSGDKLPVLYNSGSRYLPFYFIVDSVDGDTGAAVTKKQNPGDLASAITLSFNGEGVTLYDNTTAGSPTGAITIEIPTGVGDAAFLEWGGLRDPDSGHFNVSSI